jgi:hypothetical protein
MFSISTMASSTRMPTTSDIESRVTTLSVKPIRYIAAKVGIDRQRQRGGRDEGGPPVAQEEPDDEHGEHGAFDQQLHRAFEVFDHRIDEIEGLGDLMSGCSAFSFSSVARTVGHFDFAGARLRVISKPTTGLPLSSAAERCSATVSLTVATWSRRSAGRRKARCPSPPVRRPTARWRWCAPIVRCRRCRRPPEASCWICRNWREMSAAVALSASRRAGSSSTRTSRVTPPTRATAPTPRTLSMRLADRVVDEPRQRLVVHPARRHGIGQDRRAGQVDLADHRVLQVARQVGADARDGIAHVVDRLLRRLFQAEFDGDDGRAVLHLGVDVLDALQRGHRILDLARHLGFHLRRRRAGQAGGDGDGRQVDVHELLDLHGLEGHQAGQRQQDEQQDGRNRIADRPGRNVHHGLAPPSTTTFTSPSARKAGAGFDDPGLRHPARRRLRPARRGGGRA